MLIFLDKLIRRLHVHLPCFLPRGLTVSKLGIVTQLCHPPAGLAPPGAEGLAFCV